MKTIPNVEKFMTAAPHTIGNDQSLAKASQIMSEFRIRHLPVLKGGVLAGIISDRDIKMVSSLKDVDPDKTTVEEALTSDPYTVSPKAPLDEVCREMADHKRGSALVLDNHKLVGIFTWVDALKAFDELLGTRLKKIVRGILRGVNLKKDHSLRALNSFALESKAQFFCELLNTNELREIGMFLKENPMPFRFLGGGTNLILPPLILGLVIHNKISGIIVSKGKDNLPLVKVGAGEIWHDFVLWTLKNKFYGLENLSLIPGTVGGSPIQNIGAYGVDVSQFIDSVDAYDFERNEFRQLTAKDCLFSYRDSYFKTPEGKKLLVTHVSFKLRTEFIPQLSYGELKNTCNQSTVTADEVATKIIEIRNQKLPSPVTTPNVGSFFKNPIVTGDLKDKLKSRWPELISYPTPDGLFKLAAGQLIEKLGFKGQPMGPVSMYSKQALVMVNLGQAQYRDVKNLAHEIMHSAHSELGIELEIEPIDWDQSSIE